MHKAAFVDALMPAGEGWDIGRGVVRGYAFTAEWRPNPLPMGILLQGELSGDFFSTHVLTEPSRRRGRGRNGKPGGRRRARPWGANGESFSRAEGIQDSGDHTG
jgi:hypothetical protein